MESSVSDGEKLMECYQNKQQKSPTMQSSKILQPINKESETAEVNTYLEEVREFLGQPAVEKTCNLSQAKWIPDLKCVKVVKKVGKKWNYFGHRFMGNDVLYPEEAAYLLEINDLEIIHDGVPMSLQRCFSVLLSGEHGCSLLEYRVYSHLVTFGYRVFRHDPELVSHRNQNVDAAKCSEVKPQGQASSCEVKVTSNNAHFESKFTLDSLKDTQSSQTFRDILYASKSSNDAKLPVHDVDSGSSEESDKNDSYPDIVILDTNNDKRIQKAAGQNNDDIEILTLDSSDEEASAASGSKSACNSGATNSGVKNEDYISFNCSGARNSVKTEHQDVVLIEDVIMCNRPNNTRENVNMKTERRDEVIIEDFIPLKKFKNEENDISKLSKKKRRKNKRNNLQVSKSIFTNDADECTSDSIQNSSATNNIMESNISQFVQGAVNQLSEAMSFNLQGLANGNQRGEIRPHWDQSQHSFPPQNQSRPQEGGGLQQNVHNFNNGPNHLGTVTNWRQPGNYGYGSEPSSLLPTPNAMQSPFDPAFNQLSQLNQLLESINFNIQKSVGGMYKLKRLQDPNYRPMYRRPRPQTFGDRNNSFGNHGPRFNQFGDNRGHFNQFNNNQSQFNQPNQFPRYNANFNVPNLRFPPPNAPCQVPFGSDQRPNMYPTVGNQFHPVAQQEHQYGFNDDNYQRMIANGTNNNEIHGQLIETASNRLNQGSNVKQEVNNEDTSSSDEEEDDDDSDEEEEDDVKPNIGKIRSASLQTNLAPRNNKSQPTTARTVVNIKQENEPPTTSANTHIRFNSESSSSEDTSDEENAEETLADKVSDPTNVVSGKNEEKEKINKDKSTHKDEDMVEKSGHQKNFDELVKMEEESSEEDSSEEDSSEEDSNEEDSEQESSDQESSVNTESAMCISSLKKRTHIRFNIDDSDDETGELKNARMEETQEEPLDCDETRSRQEKNPANEASATQKQSGYTTDEELDRENEKIIIFHSEIITPEEKQHFLKSFSSDPQDLLNYIRTTPLSHQRIKLIFHKIRTSFKKFSESRILLRTALKLEEVKLKKRRYKVRKRLLSRAAKKQGCKTYIGTYLTSQSCATNDDDKDSDNERKENDFCDHPKEEGKNKEIEKDAIVQKEAGNLDYEKNKEQKIIDTFDQSKNATDSSEIVSSVMHETFQKSAINEIKHGNVVKTNDGEKEREVLNEKTGPSKCKMEETRSSGKNDQRLATLNENAKTKDLEEVPDENSEPTIETKESSNETIPTVVKTLVDVNNSQSNIQGKTCVSNDTDTDEISQSVLSKTTKKSSVIETVTTCNNILEIPHGTPEVVETLGDSSDPLTKAIPSLDESTTDPSGKGTSKVVNVTITSVNNNVPETLEVPKEVESHQNQSDQNSADPLNKVTSDVPTSLRIEEEQTLSLGHDTNTSVVDVQTSIEKEIVLEVKERECDQRDSHQNQCNEVNIDETSRRNSSENSKDADMDIEMRRRDSSHCSETADLLDNTEEVVDTHGDKETESLMKNEDCCTYGELYKKLDIFNKIPPSDVMGDVVPLNISFDVYCSPGKNFAKTKRGAPNYRIIVVKPDQELPSPGQMSELQSRFPDIDSVPYIFAVVLPGAVSLYRYSDVLVPTLLEELDR